jgi:hypothetical protein
VVIVSSLVTGTERVTFSVLVMLTVFVLGTCALALAGPSEQECPLSTPHTLPWKYVSTLKP